METNQIPSRLKPWERLEQIEHPDAIVVSSFDAARRGPTYEDQNLPLFRVIQNAYRRDPQ